MWKVKYRYDTAWYMRFHRAWFFLHTFLEAIESNDGCKNSFVWNARDVSVFCEKEEFVFLLVWKCASKRVPCSGRRISRIEQPVFNFVALLLTRKNCHISATTSAANLSSIVIRDIDQIARVKLHLKKNIRIYKYIYCYW